ncbi:hypothetical protein GGI12_001610 [Dipsacomyces acuminosporus]|nr:hypothetical protein GGI12_001610 [Dipsacomyces acuminosporus]
MVRRTPPPTRSGVASDNPLFSWYNSLPVCTKALLTGMVAVTLVGGTRIMWPYYPYLYLTLNWSLVWKKFQVWRLATTFLWERLSINGVLGIFYFYRDSLDLETREFGGRTADYAWFLLFCMGSMLSTSWLTSTWVLAHGLQLAVVTLWSLYRSEQIVSFFLGIRFPACYLPYAMMVFDFLANSGAIPYAMIHGWAAAHLYYYLAVDLPSQGGLDYIQTPQFLYNFFGQVRRTGRFTSSPSTTTTTSGSSEYQAPGSGHHWGSGRRLG